MSTLDLLARAIAVEEGYMNAAGVVIIKNRPARDNNPGDLEASNFANGKDSVYSTFASPLDGWKGLYRQIGLYSGRGLTLRQMVSIYAPPTENNTSRYLAAVVAATGIYPDSRLSDVLPAFDPNHPPVPGDLPGVGSSASPVVEFSSALPALDIAAASETAADWVSGLPSSEIAIGVLAAGLVWLVLLRR